MTIKNKCRNCVYFRFGRYYVYGKKSWHYYCNHSGNAIFWVDRPARRMFTKDSDNIKCSYYVYRKRQGLVILTKIVFTIACICIAAAIPFIFFALLWYKLDTYSNTGVWM